MVVLSQGQSESRPGHQARLVSGLLVPAADHPTWTINRGTKEETPYYGVVVQCRCVSQNRGHSSCGDTRHTTAARRADPREHGRQAARSKRDRPERARESTEQRNRVGTAAGDTHRIP
jgi:hypothetical protein